MLSDVYTSSRYQVAVLNPVQWKLPSQLVNVLEGVSKITVVFSAKLAVTLRSAVTLVSVRGLAVTSSLQFTKW